MNIKLGSYTLLARRTAVVSAALFHGEQVPISNPRQAEGTVLNSFSTGVCIDVREVTGWGRPVFRPKSLSQVKKSSSETRPACLIWHTASEQCSRQVACSPASLAKKRADPDVRH